LGGQTGGDGVVVGGGASACAWVRAKQRAAPSPQLDRAAIDRAQRNNETAGDGDLLLHAREREAAAV